MPPHAPPTNGSPSFEPFPHGSSGNGSPSLPFIQALIRQARRWADHALANSRLDPAYVVEKALAAISFTLTFLARQKERGQPGYAGSNGHAKPVAPVDPGAYVPPGTVVLSIPTKLVGVRAVQSNVRALRDAVRAHAVRSGLRLDLHATPNGVVVYWGDRALGRIQDKHAPWLAPLLPAHVSVHLIAVTGDEARGHTLGVNVYVQLQAGL